MKKSIFWSLTLIVIFALLLTACSGSPPDPVVEMDGETTAEDSGAGETATEEPVEEATAEETEAGETTAEEPPIDEEVVEEEVMEDSRGTFRMTHAVGWGGAESMDPIDSARFWPPITMVYDRLVTLGPDGLPAPSLATSWEANDTADVWTFTIREGVEFHDGAPLTSADVVYSINHWRSTETSTVATTLGLIDSVEAPDDHTVVVNLSQAHADFPLLVMDYRARIIPDGGAEEILTTGRGTGPFILEELDPAGTTVLVANDDYWAGPPGVARIEVIGIPDSQARIQALLAGQIDFEDATMQQAQLFEGNSDYTVQQIPTGGWLALVMRTDMDPFDNVAVRQALRLVADRQAMVELALGGAGTVSCDTPVKPDDPYRFETDCPADVERATELLAEAGYPDGIDVTLFTSDLEQDWIPIAEIYQQQAALAGINVEIQQVPTDSYFSETWMVEPFFVTRWGERPADQILNEAFRSGGTWNESYWNQEEFDNLLDEARQELDFEERRAKYQAAQELIWLEGGALIPYHQNVVRITNSCVTGIQEVQFLLIDWNLVQKPAECD